jgi:hypothetical protein
MRSTRRPPALDERTLLCRANGDQVLGVERARHAVDHGRATAAECHAELLLARGGLVVRRRSSMTRDEARRDRHGSDRPPDRSTIAGIA